MTGNYDWNKHIDDFKAEKLLKSTKKIKRLQIDIKLLNEKMSKLREENAELKRQLRDIKDASPVTKRMTKEDFALYNEGVALVKSDYLGSLKQQLADLYRRKLELDGKKDTALNRTKRHLNALAMGSVLSDIEAYENGDRLIEFRY